MLTDGILFFIYTKLNLTMSWIQQYFIDPILQNGWFNPLNTIIFAVILIACALLVYYRVLRPLKVNIDGRFFLAILPFIFWAGATRVLRDLVYSLARARALEAGTLQAFLGDIPYQLSSIQSAGADYLSGFFHNPGFAGFFSWIVTLFPTPGSYFITFFLALGVLLVSLLVQRYLKFPYWKFMSIMGLFLCIVSLWLLPLVNFYPLWLILGTTLALTGVFFVPVRLFPRTWTWPNNLVLSCHLLDASATYFSLTVFGYLEQHFLPRMLVSIDPVFMFILKIGVVIPALILIDRYAENREFRNFLKILVIILGLAPGIRDTIRLIAMV